MATSNSSFVIGVFSVCHSLVGVMICQASGLPDLDRHGETFLTRLPAIIDAAAGLVKFQFQHRHVRVPQVLVKNRREVEARLFD